MRGAIAWVDVSSACCAWRRTAKCSAQMAVMFRSVRASWRPMVPTCREEGDPRLRLRGRRPRRNWPQMGHTSAAEAARPYAQTDPTSAVDAF
jgi:hypothetical protein